MKSLLPLICYPWDCWSTSLCHICVHTCKLWYVIWNLLLAISSMSSSKKNCQRHIGVLWLKDQQLWGISCILKQPEASWNLPSISTHILTCARKFKEWSKLKWNSRTFEKLLLVSFRKYAHEKCHIRPLLGRGIALWPHQSKCFGTFLWRTVCCTYSLH